MYGQSQNVRDAHRPGLQQCIASEELLVFSFMNMNMRRFSRSRSMHQQLMRRDWDKRAQHNFMYWTDNIYGEDFRSIEDFYNDGRARGLDPLSPIFEKLTFDPQGKCILEIGCGAGRLFPAFTSAGFRDVVGVDISPEMTERARRHCPVRHAQFLLGNGVDLAGLEDSRFDYCFSYNVLQHMPDKKILWSYFQELRRVLAPGGGFQLHLRSGYPLKRRILHLFPKSAQPAAQTLFRLATFRWALGQPVGSDIVGSETTWDMGEAVPPRQALSALSDLGFKDIQTVLDPRYETMDRYWVIWRKP